MPGNLLSRGVFHAFRRMAGAWPKSDRMALFGARRGLWYTDSSRHVYEWILDNEPGIDPVWITRDPKVHQELKSKGFPVCKAASARGLFLLMRCRLAVTSAQLHDIAAVPECVPDSLRILFLGHGKSVKASSLAKKGDRSAWSRWAFLRAAELTDAAVSTSPFISRLAAESNALPVHRFHVTGYPDNDLLLEPTADMEAAWATYLAGLTPQNVVLYAPTWRKGEAVRFFPFSDFDEDRLGAFLEENKILILLRPHERDMLQHEDLRRWLYGLAERSDWIRVCDQEAFGSVNHILPFVDTLVSDYSSIYNDFLLCDRPMVFIPYDYKEFADAQGFMYDYFGTLPGPPVSSQQEFLEQLDRITSGEDPYREKRRESRDLIHTHIDAQATRRVTKLVRKLLEKQP